MGHILSIVLLLPPAPAARVLLGRVFAAISARSAAALRRITVFGPPGGLGEEGRAVVEPVEGELTGDCGRGDDCRVINQPNSVLMGQENSEMTSSIGAWG